MKARPGVMLYFDSIRPALNRFDDAQCGQLLRAIVDYAEYGVVSDLDQSVGLAFDLLAPKIDRDAEKYEKTREQRTHAVYVREKQKRGEEYLSFEEWKAERSSAETIGSISPDIENNGSYLTTSRNTSSSVTSSGKKEGKGKIEGRRGDREGKLPLTQREEEVQFEKRREAAIASLLGGESYDL